MTQIILIRAVRECNNTESLQTHSFLIVSSKKKDNTCAIEGKKKISSFELWDFLCAAKTEPFELFTIGQLKKIWKKKKRYSICAKEQKGKSAWHLPVHGHVENVKSTARVKENKQNQLMQDMTNVFTSDRKVEKNTPDSCFPRCDSKQSALCALNRRLIRNARIVSDMFSVRVELA